MSRSLMVFVTGIILFIGMPLLGWGLDDLQGFSESPARLGYAAVVVVLQIIVAIQFPNTGRYSGDGKKLVQRQRVVVALLQLLSIAIIVAAPFTDRRAIASLGEIDIMRYVGLVLFGLGFVGVNWAEATLGKQFSVQVTIQEDHKLITAGPYRLIRHPRYMGIILFSLGIALTFSSGVGMLLVALLLLVLLWRIYDEEALLRQTFGAEWDAYAKKSWHLIPYIY